MYQGVNASEGIGIGSVMVAVDPDLTFEPHEVSDVAAEKERYQAALAVFCEKTQAQADHMRSPWARTRPRSWPVTSSWPRIRV